MFVHARRHQKVYIYDRKTLQFLGYFGDGPGDQPGQGCIIDELAEKGYSGRLSVDLFRPKFRQDDPFEVAREIRQKTEPVMRQARVM